MGVLIHSLWKKLICTCFGIHLVAFESTIRVIIANGEASGDVWYEWVIYY